MNSGFGRVKALAGHALAWALLPLFVMLMPRNGEALVVIAPFASGGAIGVMARADGALIAATRFESIAITAPGEPGFANRLYAAGALFVLSGTGIAACLSTDRIKR